MKFISYIVIITLIIIGAYYATYNKSGFSIINKIAVNDLLNSSKLLKKDQNINYSNKIEIKEKEIIAKLDFPEKYKENLPTGTKMTDTRYLSSDNLSKENFENLLLKIENGELVESDYKESNLIITEDQKIASVENNKNNDTQLSGKGGDFCGAYGFGQQCGGGGSPSSGQGFCTTPTFPAVPIYMDCRYTDARSMDDAGGCPSIVPAGSCCGCINIKPPPPGCVGTLRCLKKPFCGLAPISCDQCCGGRAWLWDSVSGGCGCA